MSSGSSSVSLKEAAIVAVTLLVTDNFLVPMFAGSDMMLILKFFAQAYIVLWVDNMVTGY